VASRLERRTITPDLANAIARLDRALTYIPVGCGLLYLLAIMDGASRAVPSWRLSNAVEMSSSEAALQEAPLRFGKPQIFNTDHAAERPDIETSMDGPQKTSMGAVEWAAIALALSAAVAFGVRCLRVASALGV
jgi:transposase InsO family protein